MEAVSMEASSMEAACMEAASMEAGCPETGISDEDRQVVSTMLAGVRKLHTIVTGSSIIIICNLVHVYTVSHNYADNLRHMDPPLEQLFRGQELAQITTFRHRGR